MDKLIDAVEAGYGPGIQIDGDSIALHEPVSLSCKIRVDPELVLLCQRHGDKPHRGTRLGRMKELWPFDGLKRHILGQTRVFVQHMRSRGNEPAQTETEMEVWGPFREKADASNQRLINVEEGNPFFPMGRWVADNRGVRKIETKGPQEITRSALLDSDDWGKGAVFLVRGRFVATSGHREEATGTLIV